MDEKIYNNNRFEHLEAFISLLEDELSESETFISNEKILEIRKHIDNRDYHAMQSVMNLLFSNPNVLGNEKIMKLKVAVLF